MDGLILRSNVYHPETGRIGDRAASGFWLPPIGSCPVTASRSRQADPAERLLPGRAQAAFANPSSRAVHPC